MKGFQNAEGLTQRSSSAAVLDGDLSGSLFGATNRPARRYRQRDTPLAIVAMVAYFVGIVVISAQIFDLFLPVATRLAMLVTLVITMYYLRPPWGREELPMLLAGGALGVFLILEHIIFVITARTPPNFNAVAMYAPMLAFIPTFRARCSISTILKIFLAVTTVYLLIYTLGFHYITTTKFDSTKVVVHASDVERGTRLYLESGFASFLAFYALANKRMNMGLRVALLLLTITALYLSGYRTYAAILVLVGGLNAIRMTGIAVRLGLFAFFLAVSAIVFWGVIDPLWNPFIFFGNDSSASARSAEYVLALRTIFAHWPLGIGIPSSFNDAQDFIGTPIWKALFPTDLGILGPLIVFGVPGLIAFIGITLFSMVAPVRDLGRPEVRALRLTGVACGINGIISPSLLMEQNVVFFGLLLAIWLREQFVGRDGREPLFARSRGRWLEAAL